MKKNPLVVQMNEEQLTELVKQLRHQSPKAPTIKIENTARYKALLDSI